MSKKILLIEAAAIAGVFLWGCTSIPSDLSRPTPVLVEYMPIRTLIDDSELIALVSVERIVVVGSDVKAVRPFEGLPLQLRRVTARIFTVLKGKPPGEIVDFYNYAIAPKATPYGPAQSRSSLAAGESAVVFLARRDGVLRTVVDVLQSDIPTCGSIGADQMEMAQVPLDPVRRIVATVLNRGQDCSSEQFISVLRSNLGLVAELIGRDQAVGRLQQLWSRNLISQQDCDSLAFHTLNARGCAANK